MGNANLKRFYQYLNGIFCYVIRGLYQVFYYFLDFAVVLQGNFRGDRWKRREVR